MEISEKLFKIVQQRDPNQREYHQAVKEVLESLSVVFERRPELVPIMERLLEPDRQIMFRVAWTDDKGHQQVNRGFRVQYTNAIGPYKGGLRFHPSVTLSIIKFLAFEQVFKNSLTTLPIGAGKGGSDFDPKGKSDNEIMRFCQSFMTELSRYIGPNVDVPAGDIGVGKREIGFMFGQYKKLKGGFEGVLTGKGKTWGGSLIRPEATGYGAVYLAENMLKTRELDLKGKKCTISGSGNVAQYCTEKLLEKGAIPLTWSDSSGFIYEPEGITKEKMEILFELKQIRRGRLSEYPKLSKTGQYFEGERPWGIKCDCAFPCATQNEINKEQAQKLVDNGCIVVSEGANMPTVPEGVEIFLKNKILFGPGKAANAGGVAVSALEMSQNSLRLAWTREEVDERLQKIMKDIHEACVKVCDEYDRKDDYVFGANAAGFLKVSEALLETGY